MSGVVRLKDVAEALGISVVSVSNALSGRKGVSEEVRKQIIDKAVKMGYDTSKYQKNVDGGMQIGVIVSEKYLQVGASFYWNMYQQVAYAASRRRSFTVFEVIDKTVGNDKKLPRMLKENTIAGIIVIGWMEKPYINSVIESARVPVVLLDFYDVDFACDAVLSNNYLGMYKITKHLIDNGHRDIQFVGTIKANDNIRDRYFGFRKAMEESGFEVSENRILNDRDADTGEMNLILPRKIPSAFACNSDFTAGLLYDQLINVGYCVPDDVSIVGYDNYLYGHYFANELTTYNVDMTKMAGAAVDILFKKIKKDNTHQGVRYIDSNIIKRKSVKKID